MKELNEELAIERYHDIEIKRDSKQDLYLSLNDIVNAMLKSPDRLEVIRLIIAQPEFAEALKEIVGCYSEHEWHGWSRDDLSFESGEKLRELLSSFSDKAAQETVRTLSSAVEELKEKVSLAEKFAEDILREWPDAYAKYKPKKTISYKSNCVSSEQATKLLNYVRGQK